MLETRIAQPGTAPAGTSGQIQFNNGGLFGAVSGATSDGVVLTLVAPVLGIAAATSLTVNTANLDGTTTFTAALLNPSLVETTGPNSSTIALRGLSVAPSIGAANTQNYTGSNGFVGITVGPTITAGATGTVTSWTGETISLTNNSASAAVTNAYGLIVNNFGTSGGVLSYTAGGYFKDQTNGATGNIACLIGGSGVPSIASSWSLYIQGSNPIALTANIFTKGTIPVVTGTGSPTIRTGSTDFAGEVTGGTLATSLVITFAVAKTNIPFVVVSPQTQVAAFSYTVSTTAITITMTATTGQKIGYICVQN